MSEDMGDRGPLSDEVVASYATMLQWERACCDYSGETVYALANEVLRLRAVIDATADLHEPSSVSAPRCGECGDWPCPTHLVLCGECREASGEQ